jgi:hypothetical protein
MSFQEDSRPPLAVGKVAPAFQRNQPSQARQEETDLLKRLQQVRLDPALLVVRQLLSLRLLRCQDHLVKAPLDDVALLQGEARMLQKLLRDLAGERPSIE